MTSGTSDLEARLAQFVEHHVLHGTTLSLDELCRDRPDLREPLERLVSGYLRLSSTLASEEHDETTRGELPQFEGFQTIERIGAGGMGEVYKLRDLQLNRLVSAKVVRAHAPIRTNLADFLREARTLALFSDPRIVRIFEFRTGPPPVIVMEFVEGFELGRIGRSLDIRQRAAIVAEVCGAVHGAHRAGLQHRDLKPSNIMLDAALTPRILDFGLSSGNPQVGHLRGTLHYVAPEQLDPARPIDARTDVYALGVILYELLCGRVPYDADTESATIAAIERGHPDLPVELDPSAPEPLQAIALKAMERDPALRYQSAFDMAADLRRFFEDRPVLARPSLYTSTLTARIGPHLSAVAEWLRLRLIHPHEADRLRAAYRALEARDDDWILESRILSYTQIALYLGAFLMLAGSLFYFVAARWHEAVDGIVGPLAVLGAPFIGLNAAAHLLWRRDRRVVAVAFYLAAVALLPLLLLILFHETGILVPGPDETGHLFEEGAISNRQLQITTIVAAFWCGWLAIATRTAALSTVFTITVLLVGLSGAADLGLRTWLGEGQWDRLALHLAPIVLAYAFLGGVAERSRRPWLGRPLYVGSVALLVVVLELLALDGRFFYYLGLTLRAFAPATVSSDTLLDTIVAMVLNGIAFYSIAVALDRSRSELVRHAASLLFMISPFALLQPLGYLVRTGEYSLRLDWVYLAMAVAIALMSERRQRRAFYYAGTLNLGFALYFVALHREWFDRPAWATVVVAAGLVALGLGFLLARRRKDSR